MYRHCPLYLVAFCLLSLAACVSYKPVVVDEKTTLERDLLGQFERLNEAPPLRLPATTPVEGPTTRRALWQIMVDRRLLAPAIEPLKRQEAVGEARDGLLKPLSGAIDERGMALIERENALRQRLWQTLIEDQRQLSPPDLPQLRRAFHRMQLEAAQPGERIQRDDGRWATAR